MNPLNLAYRAGQTFALAMKAAVAVWRTSSGYFSGFWSQYVGGNASFGWLSRNGFKRNPIGFRSIYLVAYQVAKISVYLVMHKKNGEIEIDMAHPINELLRQPNTREGRLRWWMRLVGFLYLNGWAYIYAQPRLTGSKKGEPLALFVLQPNHVEEVPDNEGNVTSYRYTTHTGKIETYPAERVRKILTFDPENDQMGFPILGSAVDAIQQMISASKHNLTTLQNGGRHPGFFVAPNELGDTVFKRTKREVQEQYKKDIESQTPGLLEGGMKFERNAQTNSELDFNVSDDRAMRKIAITAGVDPALVGDSANKTYANFETAIKALIMLTVIPLLRFALDELGPWLLAMYGIRNGGLEINEDDIPELQEKLSEKWSRISAATGGPWISPDEGREEGGFSRRGGAADLIYRPFNQIALEALTDANLSAEALRDRAKKIAALKNMDPAEAAFIVMRMLEADPPPHTGDGQTAEAVIDG